MELARLRSLRTLVVHDWLVTWAGAERVLEQIVALLPHADVVTGVATSRMRAAHPVAARARETWAARLPGARTRHRWFLPVHAVAFASVDTRGYDLVVSSSHAFAKSVRVAPGATHVCYCHSPPRYLWDLADSHRADATPAQRLALALGVAPLRRLDRAAAARVTRFVANSRYVADRIRRHYGREASVVYPPVAQKAVLSAPPAREDFLLSLGRLVPYKRVDLAIAAAARLGVRLIVAGDGPERARLQALAGPHVEFRGEVGEEEAARLLATCRGLVFCAEEDFGITPVEANAHGAPVVAFGRGGAAESQIDGETGVFFAEQTVASVADGIARLHARTWDVARLHANADRFAPARFRAGFARALVDATAAAPAHAEAVSAASSARPRAVAGISG